MSKSTFQRYNRRRFNLNADLKPTENAVHRVLSRIDTYKQLEKIKDKSQS